MKSKHQSVHTDEAGEVFCVPRVAKNDLADSTGKNVSAGKAKLTERCVVELLQRAFQKMVLCPFLGSSR